MSNLLETLNEASLSDALEVLEPLVERSAWVAERATRQRPFASDQDVAQTLVNVILETEFPKRVELFRAHPELAGREASTGTMTAASTSEQGRLGLLNLSAKDARRLQDLNARYAERFGHPYIVALHRVPDLEFLFETFERRLTASSVEEHVSTLAEIASVIYARCAKAFNGATQQHACATREAGNV
ncbi:MAG: 2-oxo-4-hydroxy-4-carboxy-5-ureidoimidazoline decarboxylase [Hyphomicrobiales bacterium]